MKILGWICLIGGIATIPGVLLFNYIAGTEHFVAMLIRAGVATIIAVPFGLRAIWKS